MSIVAKSAKLLGMAIVACVFGLASANSSIAVGSAEPFITAQADTRDDEDIVNQPIDPIITGDTNTSTTSEKADETWDERHGKRKRCNFCIGYQPFPGEK